MKRLPIEQRMMIEALTGKHTKIDGTPRKYQRHAWESKRQGFPVNEAQLYPWSHPSKK
jgi:hypothetical protein